MKKLFFALFVNKKNFALVRAGLAVILAAAVLALSGFALTFQLMGPTAIQSGAELTEGTYVSADIQYIMDICGTEVDAEGTERYYLAIAPIGNRFVLLRFGARMLEDLTSLEKATMDYLTGERLAMSFHLPVHGMVETAEPGAYSLISEWFNNNNEWMEIAGVVGEAPTAATYLSKEIILVDQVGSVHWLAAIGLTALAALLMLYALTECGLVLGGYYAGSRVAARAKKRRQKNAERIEKLGRSFHAAIDRLKAAVKSKKDTVTAEAEAEPEPATEPATEPEPEPATEPATEPEPEPATEPKAAAEEQTDG